MPSPQLPSLASLSPHIVSPSRQLSLASLTPLLLLPPQPNNIGFLVGSGRLVLFDFGLASIWKRDPGGGRDKSMDEPNEVRPLTGQTAPS